MVNTSTYMTIFFFFIKNALLINYYFQIMHKQLIDFINTAKNRFTIIQLIGVFGKFFK